MKLCHCGKKALWSCKCLKIFLCSYHCKDHSSSLYHRLLPITNLFEISLQSMQSLLSEDYEILTTCHISTIKCLLITKDNLKLISGGLDKTIRIWDISTCKQDFILTGHDSGIFCLAFFNDPEYLVSADSLGCIRIWSLSMKTQLKVCPNNPYPIYSLATSSKNNFIFSGDQYGQVRSWEINSNELGSHMFDMEKVVNSLIVTPNEKYLICASSNKIFIQNIENFEDDLEILSVFESFTTCIAITDDSKSLFQCTSRGVVRVWDFENRREIKSLQHSSCIFSIAVTRSQDKLIAGCSSGEIVIWSLGENYSKSIFSGHYSNVESLVIESADKYLFSAGYDRVIRVWDLEKNIEKLVLPGHSRKIEKFHIMDDGKHVLTGGHDCLIILWNLQSKCEEMRCIGHKGTISCINTAQGFRFVVSGDVGGNVIVWGLLNNEKLVFDGENSPVCCTGLSLCCGYAVSGDLNGKVRVFDLKKHTEISFCAEKMTGISLTQSSKYVLTTTPLSAKIWRICQ